ncbi:uncharacterized protein BXIN_1526 [Babesia sp. Xinjiang]|uniref:uncharacterized protein n=1 Tax=Babesia sp. Xinjiang TaxID=462227 RepID=UPI000A2205D8|nr:uncharacterized protein BXIN_1526 [Babesia sp. Xinjiang]ORM42176.1 hypothetical protein BXIN_1526 [Babesia sp. Xinjiang]
MSYSCKYTEREQYRGGITPYLSCLVFFTTGINLTLIFAIGYIGAITLSEGFGVNIELARYCYQTRQLITVYALLGAIVALLLGLGGRTSCLVHQWMLTLCYYATAAYLQSNKLDIHIKLPVLMRFAAITAFISSIAQTAAIYCMADNSMPGGAYYGLTRITAYFAGATLAAPTVASWIIVQGYFGIETNAFQKLYYQNKACSTLIVICCFAGTLSAVAAALMTYLFFSVERNTAMEETCWFPLIRKSTCHINKTTIKRQMTSIYMPLLWTVNPLFIAFAIGVTLNSTNSFRLIVVQSLIYAICAIFSVYAAYLSYGSALCVIRQYGKPEVMKTVMQNTIERRGEVSGNTQNRSSSYSPTATQTFPYISRNTQWSLLKGEMWAKWQNFDATYLLCYEPLMNLYTINADLICLEIGEFYDNVEPAMKQYLTKIECTGLLHDLPFAIDCSWTPMQMLHQMILHQKMVVMLQLERTGQMFNKIFKGRVSRVSCSVLERIPKLSLCCTSILDEVDPKTPNNSISTAKDSNNKNLKCQNELWFAKEVPNCKCCSPKEQKDIEYFLKGSIDSTTRYCETLIGNLKQEEGLQDTSSVPVYRDLDIEQKLACVVRSYCEANLRILKAILMIEEFLLLQEWLCKLSWKLYDANNTLKKLGICNCNDKSKTLKNDHTHNCPWNCLQQLLPTIVQLLMKLHLQKTKLLIRIKKVSICCVKHTREELLNKNELETTGILDVIRILIIVTLAIGDLIKLKESLEQKKCNCAYSNQDTKHCFCIARCHLILSATQYMENVLKQILSPSVSRIESLVDSVLVWYAGLCDNLSQLCSEIDWHEQSSYAPLIHMDKDIGIDYPKDNTIYVGSVIGKPLYSISMLHSLLAFGTLKIRSQKYSSQYKQTKPNVECNETTNIQSSLSNCFNCCNAGTSIAQNAQTCSVGNIEKIFCNLAENIKGAIECAEQIKCCGSKICDINKCLEFCNSNISFPNVSEEAPCKGDCCKDESEVSRYCRLILSLSACVKALQCATATEPVKTCCCSNYANSSEQCSLECVIARILRYCFGCSTCCVVVPDTKLCCVELYVLCHVYCSLNGGTTFERCQDCEACTPDTTTECNCIPNNGAQCQLCNEAESCCANFKDVCCCYQCWMMWVRCYVMCGECCSFKCDTIPPCCENSCYLTWLTNSIFHCTTCASSTDGQTGEESTNCCGTNSQSSQCCTMISGSETAISKKCCNNQLGCTLRIVTKDLKALKVNTCTFTKNIKNMLCCSEKIKTNICILDRYLKEVASFLCYIRCDLEERIKRLEALCTVAQRLDYCFPCYAETIGEIAKRDESMIQYIPSLVKQCLDLAYKEFMLSSSFIWTFATVCIQYCSLRHLNKRMTILYGSIKKNWMTFLSFGGRHNPMSGEYSTMFVDGIPLAERNHLIGIYGKRTRRKDMKHNINVHMDDVLNESSILGCFKYVWILLCLLAVIKFFYWFGLVNSVRQSMPLLTFITMLGALHLSAAVRGSAHYSSAYTSSGGKTATRINMVMLIGLIAMLVILWISNIISTYGQISMSVAFVAERMRLLGYYDTVKPPAKHLLIRTIAWTTALDLERFFGMWRPRHTDRNGSEAYIPYLGGSLADSTASSNPRMKRGAMRKPLTLPKFLETQMVRTDKTIHSILDLISFLGLYPSGVNILNQATKFDRNSSVDIQALWSAWEMERRITNESFRLEAIHEDALRGLNIRVMGVVGKVKSKRHVPKLIMLWNAFFEVQRRSIPQRVMRIKQWPYVVTKSQNVLEKEQAAHQYIREWERFCRWLARCTKYFKKVQKMNNILNESVQGKSDLVTKLYNILTKKLKGKVPRFPDEIDDSTLPEETEMPTPKVETSETPEAALRQEYERRAEIEAQNSRLRRTTHLEGFAPYEVLSEYFDIKKILSDDEFAYLDDVIDEEEINYTTPRKVSSVPSVAEVDSDIPESDNNEEAEELPVEEPEEVTPVDDTTVKEDVHDTDTADPLDWLLDNDPCKECLQFYKNSTGINADMEVPSYITLKSGYSYEMVPCMDMLLANGLSWKMKKEQYCGTLNEHENICMEAVQQAYTKLVTFSEEQHVVGNLVKMFYGKCFPSILNDGVARENSALDFVIGELAHIIIIHSAVQKPSIEPDSPNVRSAAYKRHHGKTSLMPAEETNCKWQYTIKGLGQWSVFNGMPVSQSAVRSIFT